VAKQRGEARSAPGWARWAVLVLLSATLVISSAVARAQGSPAPGGSVPSLLSLSIGEPSPLTRGGPGGVYTATVPAALTATDIPVRLSLVDGEATGGSRRGHLGRGTSLLPDPLWAAADGGPFRSLDTSVPMPLRRWRQPLAAATTKIRLRQTAPSARALRAHRKLLLVTVTVAGP